MPTDKYDILGSIYASIGKECRSIVGENVDGLYLYGEAGEGYSGGAIFMDEGAIVRYHSLNQVIFDLLLQAWEIEDQDQKWALMEYSIEGSRFDAKLIYPEDIDSNLSISDRRGIFLRRRFGDKPVIYPAW